MGGSVKGFCLPVSSCLGTAVAAAAVTAAERSIPARFCRARSKRSGRQGRIGSERASARQLRRLPMLLQPRDVFQVDQPRGHAAPPGPSRHPRALEPDVPKAIEKGKKEETGQVRGEGRPGEEERGRGEGVSGLRRRERRSGAAPRSAEGSSCSRGRYFSFERRRPEPRPSRSRS
jgi:hypothetical protein